MKGGSISKYFIYLLYKIKMNEREKSMMRNQSITLKKF